MSETNDSADAPAVESPEMTESSGQVDTAALLQAVAGGGIDPMSALMSQFGGAAMDDPKMALLMKLFEQRRSAPTAEIEAEESDSQEDVPSEPVVTRRECAMRMRELSQTAKQIYAELEVLRERNDTLAAAVGACFLCFGSDAMCEECGGRGLPGSRLPEPSAYREFIVPALRRARMSQATHQRTMSAGATRGSTNETSTDDAQSLR